MSYWGDVPQFAGRDRTVDIEPTVARSRMKLGQVFDPRNNALNALRLVLATGVFLGHSFALTGRQISFAPADQLAGQLWVDGFFAISGFLVTSSWLRDPRVGAYFVARGLRIFPGLWVCLIITAFVIAPIGVALQGGQNLWKSEAPIAYVLNNCTSMTFQVDIGGSPQGVPHPGMWNGSLWTLQFEVLCYILVVVFGVLGLLRRRWFLPAAMTLALVWSALLPPWTSESVSLWQILARFAVMFLAGALLHQFRDVIPARWSIVAVCIAIVLAASFLPNYRLAAALPLAYVMIVSGALIHNERFNFRNDLSYGVYIYAWPLQQLLVIVGLGFLNPLLFACLVAVPVLALAALSWFLVEKRALSLKSRLRGRVRSQRAPSVRTGGPVPDGVGSNE
jgi:peptidoglycan/LPS O-acetylase OafA/YrhL